MSAKESSTYKEIGRKLYAVKDLLKVRTSLFHAANDEFMRYESLYLREGDSYEKLGLSAAETKELMKKERDAIDLLLSEYPSITNALEAINKKKESDCYCATLIHSVSNFYLVVRYIKLSTKNNIFSLFFVPKSNTMEILCHIREAVKEENPLVTAYYQTHGKLNDFEDSISHLLMDKFRQ